MHGDIADRDSVARIFAEHAPTAVVNLAAETHVDRSIDGPRAFVDANIVGTFVLLETSREFVGGLPPAAAARFRFLHVSTDAVYGSLGADGRFSEETPYAPNSPYAASKASADHLARAYAHTYRLPVLITNCSNNYGPYQFPEKLIPLMILNAIDRRPLPIYGDGGNVRDWLHVEDHCAGILLVLREGRAGEKYNVGGGNERSNLELVDAVRRSTTAPPRPVRQLRSTVIERSRHSCPIGPADRRYGRRLKIRGLRGRRHALEENFEPCAVLDHRDWCDQVRPDATIGNASAEIRRASSSPAGRDRATADARRQLQRCRSTTSR